MIVTVTTGLGDNPSPETIVEPVAATPEALRERGRQYLAEQQDGDEIETVVPWTGTWPRIGDMVRFMGDDGRAESVRVSGWSFSANRAESVLSLNLSRRET
jgi:hypothetical protein